MFGCIYFALCSIVSVLSCMTACWFCTCSCSGLTPTIINEDYYYYYYRWLRLFRVHQSTHGNTPHAKTHFPTFPVSPEHFKTLKKLTFLGFPGNWPPWTHWHSADIKLLSREQWLMKKEHTTPTRCRRGIAVWIALDFQHVPECQ